MLPEFQALASEVDVWVMLSLFTHVTDIPREIAIGLGLYAVVVFALAPETMVTVEPAVEPEGLVGVELGLLLPQLVAAMSAATPRMNRVRMTSAPFTRHSRKGVARTAPRYWNDSAGQPPDDLRKPR